MALTKSQATKALIQAFLKAVAPYELASHGERHGSWEWVAQRWDGPICRSVRLALTPLGRPDGTGKTIVDVEVYAGAELKDRFHQDLLSTESVPDIHVSSDAFRSDLSQRLRKAVERADELAQADLDQIYPTYPELRRA